MSSKEASFKNKSEFDKKVLFFMIGMVAYCGTLTALCIKEKDYKHAAFQGVCTAINATCTAKMIRDARKQKVR